MSLSQRRLGPYNLGVYGILSSILNGLNLILCQLIIMKIQLHYGFQLFPCLFFIISFISYYIICPSLLIGTIISFFIVLILYALVITFLCFIPISSIGKYSLLSCIRLITQQISFELISSIVFSIFVYPLLDFILISYSQSNSILTLDYLLRLINTLITYLLLITLILFHSHYLIIIVSFIFILGDCNRVPFDLIEAESELIAGFIIDYSSIYFSIILLTEYGNIIIFLLLFIILLLIIVHLFYYYVIIVCLIRASLNRIKFNEKTTPIM